MINWFINESGFKKYLRHIYIYYNYSPYGIKIVVLSYVDDCVYWYTSEALGKNIVETLGEIFHVNFLVFAHWLRSISIPQPKNHSISVYHARYATSVVDKYLDNFTVKKSTKFYKTTLTSGMIFTKSNSSNSDEQVQNFSMEFNIHYRAFIGLLIYLFSKRVDLRFAVHKLEKIIKYW